MSHVLLRCDATPDGGVGHLVRCLSVAEAARAAGWTVSLAGTVTSDLGLRLLADAGLAAVPPGPDLATDAAEHGASVVHVDDYAAGPGARAELAVAHAVLSSMEDGRFGRRPADVVVDPTVGAASTARPEDGSAVLLRGLEYAPMRAEVRAARQARLGRWALIQRPPAGLRGVVVLGGTDAMNASADVAGVCARSGVLTELVTVAPRHRWETVRAAAPDAVVVEPSAGVVQLLADADVVVSAAGTTAWELACMGVPTVLVAVTDNQVAGYAAALRHGLAAGLGTLEELRADPAAAAAALPALVERAQGLAAGAADAVDGRGAERIVAAWDDALAARVAPGAASRVVVRSAVAQDALLLLRWRNDPVVRAASRTTDPVPAGPHVAWLDRFLADPGRSLLVATADGVPVGTVRLDLRGDGEGEVSITLAPEARGRGLAGAVLRAAEDAFVAERGPLRLVAVVADANAPSRRTFLRAGYRDTGAAERGPDGARFGVYARDAAGVTPGPT